MKNPVIRRILALLLVSVMLISGTSVYAMAEDDASEPAEAETDPTEKVTEPTEETGEPEATEETAEPTEAPTEMPEETVEPATEPTEAMPEAADELRVEAVEEAPVKSGKQNPDLYFGQLHAHSSFSSGTEDPAALYAAAREAGMDFFAITDHGDSLAREPSRWERGKAAAEAAGTETFLGVYGYEMSWPEGIQIGHISAFHTQEFQSWEQPEYKSYTTGLENYYDTLEDSPETIGQWNHPGNQYGTFSGFAGCSPERDRVIHLLEAAGGYEKYYSRALDKGWHIAPSAGESTGRTVIRAEELTEAGLYEAIRNHRVYATADPDLEIVYTLDGCPMGSSLKQRQVGETADILVDLYDPADETIGTVEVIVDGGKTAARQTADGAEILSFSVPGDYSYYYLRITQPDGDVAVTAPVWVEESGDLEITGLTCRTAVPVQNEPVTLVLDLYNGDKAAFSVGSLEIKADGVTVSTDETLTEIPGETRLSRELTFRYDGIGQTEITVRLAGTLDGETLEYETKIPLSFRLSQQVTDILVDGSHGNAGLQDLNLLKAMAAEQDIRITLVTGDLTEEMLKTCRFFLITAPEEPFSETFLGVISEYVRSGGSLLLCGQSAVQGGTEELNRLLEAAGATLRMNNDTLTDSLYNGGEESLLYLTRIDTDAHWCSGVTEGQIYRHAEGCSVDPGRGQILVGQETAAALAWEETSAGGAILAAGSLLVGDAELKAPVNIWDAPYANRTIAENLLGIGGETQPLSTIRQAREAQPGTLHRIRGYVTAGTSNSGTGFPETLYLQDDTGGIGVIPFAETGISIGTPVEVTGTAQLREGNRILKPISHKVLEGQHYRYLPRTGDWKTLLDPALHGGELVEVEGQCTEIIRKDGTVSGITLKDDTGNMAYILVEPYIFSAATGKNDLQENIRKGGTIRAIGILHVDTAGKPVIRIRNCQEVTYVPPRKEYTPAKTSEEYVNPKTGDWLMLLLN